MLLSLHLYFVFYLPLIILLCLTHFHPPTYVFASCLALVLFPASVPVCTVWSEWIRLGWLS
jgi:hypothetical protein